MLVFAEALLAGVFADVFEGFHGTRLRARCAVGQNESGMV